MSNNVYDLKSVKLPYLAGGMLKLFVSLVEGPLGGLLTPSLMQSAGLTWFRKQAVDEAPTPQPIHYAGAPATQAASAPESEWPKASPVKASGFHFATVHDYARAYREGKTTPEEVAQKVLDAIADSNASNPPLRAVIAVNHEDVLRQAREATARIKAGKPLGIFDGVPVAVKDELDMTPYPTTVGTAFLGTSPAKEDATVVSRMRDAGALLVGKTNMHEIGIGVTGLNPHHGTTRNPYNPDHFTGGSSSGSATAVAAGLVPVALGADGGGSIRIPSSFCGIFGLKATYGRVSEHGAAPLCWSVAHVGPIACSATDAALAYAVMSGPDPRDPNSLRQPLPSLEGWNINNMDGVKLGVFWPWFRHAEAEVVAACEAMLKQFEARGAEIREVVIPDLELNRVAHTVTIAGEMAQALSYWHREHHRQHGLDVRTNLDLARAFTATDYVLAQRARTRMIGHFNRAFTHVDAILTPATGIAAPPIPKDALPNGNSDLTTLVEIMRFATQANLTGFPTIAFPVGYTAQGLPIGMQAIGRAWEEALLLRVAVNAEEVVERRKPRVWYGIL